jgi:hypothetical protein
MHWPEPSELSAEVVLAQEETLWVLEVRLVDDFLEKAMPVLTNQDIQIACSGILADE